MGEGSYFNFDLIIERVGKKYRARVFDSPAGQASAEFELPFSELELENFVLRMGRPRAGVRRVDSSELEAVKQCGERLFRAVFTDDVYASFLRSRDTALEEGKGLRVRLRIDVPEFHDYPWEFLYNAHLNQFLALSKDTPVVRYLELPYPVQPLMVQPPLKILVMISSPEGFPQLNVEEEWRRLSNALAPLLRRGLVTLERLKSPTLSALQQHLRRGEYHIFHFVGHGTFSEHKQDGMLLLEEENGRGRPVSGQYLGTVLHDHRSLRLVVLNACEGARTSQEDPYAGVAQTLVLQGIPAVIAMQFEIVETAAITFAQEFYGAVADGFPVDAAVSEARKAIFATGNDVEWGTPVLYMRAPQGVIFEIPEALRARHPLSDEPIPYVDKELEQKLEGLYTEGLAAFWVEDWDKACDRFQKILADRPDHAAAADKLAEAKRQRRLANLYARAAEAQGAENWPMAQKTLEELLKDSPEYKDAAVMLKAVKKQKQLAELYTEAKQLHAAKKWQAVAKVFAQLKSIDPEYPDPENLLSTAEKELDELKRQAELNELYSRAVHAMDAGQWGEAQNLLGQVQAMEPGFLETEKLLSKAESEIRKSREEQKRRDQINTLYEQAHGLLRSKKWRQALDKVGEIRKLDEQFEDTEKIAEQAQKELEREEQEAERQNELAAMYAEAVRLLREEKYQEALNQWQQIRGIDARYPDRQKVQRMARKSLATLAKPAAKKLKISIPKSLWIGLGGVVTLAIIIALILIGNGSEEATSSSTNVPVKTSTPKSPTATPVTSGYADPTLYDDFDNPAFDYIYNEFLWEIYASSSKYFINQKEGKLSIEINDRGLVSLSLKEKTRIIKPTFFEMRAYLAPSNTNSISQLYIYISTDQGQTNCGVFGVGNSPQNIKCWSEYFGKKVESNLGLDGIAPGWHTFRFEIETETMTVLYIIDGIRVGEFIPKDAIPDNYNDFKNLSFTLWIGLDNKSSTRALVGYVDYVRMGAIEDDPVKTSLPTATNLVPSSTQLPGKLVLPIDTFEKTIPWLPLDTNAVPTVHFIGFNITRPPFDNTLIRQAFAYAIDRQIIVDMAREYKANNPSLATTLTPPETLGRDLSGEVGIGFDPQKAKELFSEAGYSNPSNFPIVTFLVSVSGDIAPGARFNMATAMADMWQTHLGITVQVQAMNRNDYLELLRTDPPNLFWIGWVADYNDPDNFLREIYHSDASGNFGNFSNPEFDQLVNLAADSKDPAERQELYIRAERLLCETKAAMIPIYHTTSP